MRREVDRRVVDQPDAEQHDQCQRQSLQPKRAQIERRTRRHRQHRRRLRSRHDQLSGGEITILKAIGLSGSQVAGKFLIERIEEVEAGELIDTLGGLVEMGYLLSTKVNIRTMQDVERSSFRVNPSYAHDLKDALDPYRRREQEKHRRRRRG